MEVYWYYTKRLTRTARTCFGNRRGARLLFVFTACAMYTAMGITTNYLVERHNRMSPCHIRHYSTTELIAYLQYVDGFGWSVFYTLVSFTTALVVILATLLKLHEDLAWNIPTWKLMMWYAAHHPLDKLEPQIKRFLNVSMWVLLAVGFLFVIILYEYIRNAP